MKINTEPYNGAGFQHIFQSIWFFVVFHILFIAAWFLSDINFFGVFCVWFAIQFGIHAGYHRYFSHGSFRTRPWMEFLLAFLGSMALQNGPVWWASKHRNHHRFSDTDRDCHSPKHGFWHAHIGWLWTRDSQKIDWTKVPDLCRPIPIFFERYQIFFHLAYVICLILFFGWAAPLAYWVIPIVICWHTTFSTNSICHTFGSKPYLSRSSKYTTACNNIIVAVLNLGEGWHNNHHAFPTCSHHGYHKWYQLDVVYLVLFFLEKLDIVWNLRKRSTTAAS